MIKNISRIVYFLLMYLAGLEILAVFANIQNLNLALAFQQHLLIVFAIDIALGYIAFKLIDFIILGYLQ